MLLILIFIESRRRRGRSGIHGTYGGGARSYLLQRMANGFQPVLHKLVASTNKVCVSIALRVLYALWILLAANQKTVQHMQQ